MKNSEYSLLPSKEYNYPKNSDFTLLGLCCSLRVIGVFLLIFIKNDIKTEPVLASELKFYRFTPLYPFVLVMPSKGKKWAKSLILFFTKWKTFHSLKKVKT